MWWVMSVSNGNGGIGGLIYSKGISIVYAFSSPISVCNVMEAKVEASWRENEKLKRGFVFGFQECYRFV